jgi:predicted permease
VIEDLSRDLSYAARTLLRSPVFTLVAALSLALGIGANTAIFSLINALLLRPLPVREPAQLVAVGDPARTGSISTGSVRNDLFSYPLYERVRDQSTAFSGVYASGRSGRLRVGLAGSPGEPEPARGRLVSGNYFAVLGVPAARGRTFSAQEDRAPGASPVVVISHDYWRRRFASDPGAVGRLLTINGAPFTVIGVTPAGFLGDVVGLSTDLWIPVTMQPQVNPGRQFLDRWDTSWLLLMGRLRPGVPLARARTEVDALVKRAFAEARLPEGALPDGGLPPVPAGPGGAGFSWLRPQFAQPLITLMGLVGLVLLIACANVANLLLERAMGRRKEIAVRLALGAGRARLIRQLLTESVLLAGLGAALGLLFALWAGPALLGLASGSVPIVLDLHPDLPTLAFTAGAALLTGILFGLTPAVRATRVELASTLKENARSVTGGGAGAGRWRLGRLLVVAQFALSLLLLTGAGLFVRSLQNLESLDLGLDRAHLVLMNTDPIAAGYTGARLEDFPFRLAERLAALPGVDAVTFSENGIFSGTENSNTTTIEGVATPPGEGVDLNYDHVGPDYFAAVGTPVLLGRGLGPQDRKGAPLVAVVNEALAQRYFPTGSPLGRHITIDERSYEIVGVARDARDHDLRDAVPPRFYMPFAQAPETPSNFNFEIRTRRPAAVVDTVRRAAVAFDPDLPASDLRPLAAMIDDSISHERMIAQLSAVFGLVALVLAAIGLYGVLSYTIARRTNEIGIRMALGAGRPVILRMVLRETLFLALVGVAVGVPLAIAAARMVSSRLFGLSAHDPGTLAAATVILVLVSVLAGLIPGSRATRVSPTEALRYG